MRDGTPVNDFLAQDSSSRLFGRDRAKGLKISKVFSQLTGQG
jgi:hypothetical protein